MNIRTNFFSFIWLQQASDSIICDQIMWQALSVIQNLLESNGWCDCGDFNVSKIDNKLPYRLDHI